MNLEQVASFLAVVRTGNFRSAARERGLTQGAVSQHIKKLEAFLSSSLLERTHQGCVTTPEGARFVPHAESLLRMNARALSSILRDCVAVGASSNIGTYMLQPYVKSFLDIQNRTCDVDVQIHQNPVVADKLSEGEIDVAVMEWWDERPGCSAYLWRREELVVIVPPDHIWAALSYIPVSLLKGAPMLAGESGTGTGRLLSRYFGEEAVNLKIVMHLGSTEAVKQWVIAGLGISLVLASTVEHECREGGLCAIPLEGQPLYKDLFVIWRDSLGEDSQPRRFAESLRQSVK
ncbi:MAG: LysR family transcriptional regulator [Halothiobacillus sp.]|nr:LysR family transcriptional regulator [Halothiobacillus sp.]